MERSVSNDAVGNTFRKLAQIEDKHKERIYRQYHELTAEEIGQDKFAAERVAGAVEGGMTTEEYIAFFQPDLESVEGVLSLAMSIEAQALDLYTRAGERAQNESSRDFLTQMAAEEQSHLERLARLMDTAVAERS
jgi:rubrerythrin